ncbi:MAG: hypothetical protein AAGB51_02995 [Planctomycetota bacterium]
MTALIDRVEAWCHKHGISTTSDWQIRCTRCDRTRNLKGTGVVRIGGAGPKYTMSRCTQCNALVRARIERVPTVAGHHH